MNLIINCGKPFSEYQGIEYPTRDVISILCVALKEGRAKKMIDTPEILGYLIN